MAAAGFQEAWSQAHGQRRSMKVLAAAAATQDDVDPDDDSFEEFWSVWLFRVVAVSLWLAGTGGVSEYETVDSVTCPHNPAILTFWTATARLSGSWIVLDVAACSVFLRIMWFASRFGGLVRLFSFSAWCLAIYGLTQYSMQLPMKRCWSTMSIFIMITLMFATVAPILYCLIVDCDNMCTTCGEAGHDTCLSGFEMPEWREVVEVQAQECGDLELAVRKPPRAHGSIRGAGASSKHLERAGTDAGAASSTRLSQLPGGLSPAVVGRRSMHAASQQGVGDSAKGRISVIRNGQVLHVGRSRRGVKRWVRRYMPDKRGVTIEDTTTDAGHPGRSPNVETSKHVARPASPSSPPSGSEAGSNPPSANLTPRNLQPQR